MKTILSINNKLKILEEKQRNLNLKISNCKDEEIKKKLIIEVNLINMEYLRLIKNIS